MQLAIDTSTETASVALWSAGEVVAELTWHSGQNHTVELLSSLVHLLHQAKVKPRDIKAIIVAKGPGSFNGLRVGMATAKGLAYSLGIPIIGISTLEAEAFQHAKTGLPVCPIFNAGRGEVASALYQWRNGRWHRLIEEHITTIEALCPGLRGRTVFCGNILPHFEKELKERLGRRAVVLKAAFALRRAGFLAELGWRRLEGGEVDDLASLQPLYLRRPSISGTHAEDTRSS